MFTTLILSQIFLGDDVDEAAHAEASFNGGTEVELLRLVQQLLIDSSSDADSDADLYNWKKLDATFTEDKARLARAEVATAERRALENRENDVIGHDGQGE